MVEAYLQSDVPLTFLFIWFFGLIVFPFHSQSRVSPFANRRTKSSGGNSRDGSSGASSSARQGFEEQGSEYLSGWSNFKRFLRHQFKALTVVKRSPEGLHGCVAFEVEWANVRGINYLNELLVSWRA